MELYIFILMLFSIGGSFIEIDTCEIFINGDLPEPQPLLLLSGSKRGFVYPSQPGEGGIKLDTGDSIQLACPGSRFLQDTVAPNNALVECVNNKTFSLIEENVITPFSNITCNRYPQPEIKLTTKTCYGEGLVGEIGFPVESSGNTEFYTLIDFCHNENIGHTFYAHAQIPAEIDAFQSGFGRPTFKQGNFFKGLSLNSIYKKKNQLQVIAKTLNSSDLAEDYIRDKGEYFFAKGHLVAKADFIYGSQQRATFYYVNAVPMWQNVNSGNWARIEDAVRKYANDHNQDLDVWTGAIGILQAKDFDGNLQDIYLYNNFDKKKSVPVPKLLFKVVYCAKCKKGIVFVTINDPHLTKITKDLLVCKNVCDKISYITWVKPKSGNEFEKGYSYCCGIDDFRKVFPDIPKFKTKDLLI